MDAIRSRAARRLGPDGIHCGYASSHLYEDPLHDEPPQCAPARSLGCSDPARAASTITPDVWCWRNSQAVHRRSARRTGTYPESIGQSSRLLYTTSAECSADWNCSMAYYPARKGILRSILLPGGYRKQRIDIRRSGRQFFLQLWPSRRHSCSGLGPCRYRQRWSAQPRRVCGCNGESRIQYALAKSTNHGPKCSILSSSNAPQTRNHCLRSCQLHLFHRVCEGLHNSSRHHSSKHLRHQNHLRPTTSLVWTRPLLPSRPPSLRHHKRPSSSPQCSNRNQQVLQHPGTHLVAVLLVAQVRQPASSNHSRAGESSSSLCQRLLLAQALLNTTRVHLQRPPSHKLHLVSNSAVLQHPCRVQWTTS
jgi:hypothetical protein